VRIRKKHVVFCSYDGCSKKMLVRSDGMKLHSGLCKVHSHVKRPFESIYNRLFNDWRKTPVELSYEEFVELMKVNECHYCQKPIARIPFATVEGKFLSTAYCLDKKNPKGPYSKANCVTCCWDCNRIKGNVLTYEEMKAAMRAVLKVRNSGS
jgi:hypothetical protein